MHLADELLEHFLGVGEVGDDAVLHRPVRGDVAGCAAEHALGFGAHRRDFPDAVVVANGHDGRLVEHDALAADVDEGIGSTEVDRQVVREQAAELLEHQGSLENRGFREVD